MSLSNFKIAVVIPSYKVTQHIMNVLNQMGSEVWKIYVVDDCCPDQSGRFVESQCQDPRVRVLFHSVNLGVGGAVLTGYQQAVADGADILVKVDGDGQMNPALIPDFVLPIINGEADYTKGNRFFDLSEIGKMPAIRIFGNSCLSFLTKFSSGYWDIFDPTNGYTALHASLVEKLPVEKISKRYFFETDMLFRLGIARAVVKDIPMHAHYGDEVSGLNIMKIIPEFTFKNLRNLIKRVFYNYYLRDISIASIELPIGLSLILFGIVFGGYHWIKSSLSNITTSAGTVMLAGLPLIVGLQMLLAFLNHDMNSVPKKPLHLKNKIKMKNTFH